MDPAAGKWSRPSCVMRTCALDAPTSFPSFVYSHFLIACMPGEVESPFNLSWCFKCLGTTSRWKHTMSGNSTLTMNNLCEPCGGFLNVSRYRPGKASRRQRTPMMSSPFSKSRRCTMGLQRGGPLDSISFWTCIDLCRMFSLRISSRSLRTPNVSTQTPGQGRTLNTSRRAAAQAPLQPVQSIHCDSPWLEARKGRQTLRFRQMSSSRSTRSSKEPGVKAGDDLSSL